MTTEPRDIVLSAIRTDGGTQIRVELDKDVFLEYGQRMASGEQFPPIDVFFDGKVFWLADGFHRFYGSRESRQHTIPAIVHDGTVRDAILFACKANTSHGLRRSNADKRHAVLTLLEDRKWRKWSDRKIAEACAVTHPFVADVRREWWAKQKPDGRQLETVTSSADERIGRDGKRRKHRKKRNVPDPQWCAVCGVVTVSPGETRCHKCAAKPAIAPVDDEPCRVCGAGMRADGDRCQKCIDAGQTKPIDDDVVVETDDPVDSPDDQAGGVAVVAADEGREESVSPPVADVPDVPVAPQLSKTGIAKLLRADRRLHEDLCVFNCVRIPAGHPIEAALNSVWTAYTALRKTIVTEQKAVEAQQK